MTTTPPYRFADVTKGAATVTDTAQHIARGYIRRRDGKTWEVSVPCPRYLATADDGTQFYSYARTVAAGLPTRTAAAQFTMWYDSHRTCCPAPTLHGGHPAADYLTEGNRP